MTSLLCVEWCRGAESLNPDSSGLRTGSLLTWRSGFNSALYQYRSKIKGPTMGTLYSGWCRGAELNRRHADFQSAALPTELPRHFDFCLPGSPVGDHATGVTLPTELPRHYVLLLTLVTFSESLLRRDSSPANGGKLPRQNQTLLSSPNGHLCQGIGVLYRFQISYLEVIKGP